MNEHIQKYLYVLWFQYIHYFLVFLNEESVCYFFFYLFKFLHCIGLVMT